MRAHVSERPGNAAQPSQHVKIYVPNGGRWDWYHEPLRSGMPPAVVRELQRRSVSWVTRAPYAAGTPPPREEGSPRATQAVQSDGSAVPESASKVWSVASRLSDPIDQFGPARILGRRVTDKVAFPIDRFGHARRPARRKRKTMQHAHIIVCIATVVALKFLDLGGLGGATDRQHPDVAVVRSP